MNPLLLLGNLIVSIKAGKCSGCGTMRMFFVNAGGRTRCAGCVAKESKSK